MDRDVSRSKNYSSLMNMDRKISSKKTFVKDYGHRKSNSDGKRSRSSSPKRTTKKSKDSQKSESKKKEEGLDIPDRSLGDYFCKHCDSHMNSEQMWDAHIQGKRHLKHTKRLNEVVEQKFEYANEPPSIKEELKKMTDPIVGLDHLCEIQRVEQKPTYQCFLCSVCMPTFNHFKEHIVCLKHRMAYLKEHDKERHDLIIKSNLKKGQIEPVVEEVIAKHEIEKGRGKIMVKKEKVRKFPIKQSMNLHSESSFQNDRMKKNQRYNNDLYHEDRDLYGPDKGGFSPRNEYESPYYADRDQQMGDYLYERDFKDGIKSKRDQYNFNTSSVEERSTYHEPYGKFESAPNKIPEGPSIPNSLQDPMLRLPGLDSPPPKKDPAANFNQNTNPRITEQYSAETSKDTGSSSSSWPQVPKPKPQDLREVLDQKKSQASAAAETGDTAISSVPDHLLQMIDALPTMVFLQLALFKLDNLAVENDVETKMLDKVVNKATALSVDVKSKQNSSVLRAKFNKSMGNVTPTKPTKDYSQDINQLMQMVNEYKVKSSIKTATATPAVPAQILPSLRIPLQVPTTPVRPTRNPSPQPLQVAPPIVDISSPFSSSNIPQNSTSPGFLGINHNKYSSSTYSSTNSPNFNIPGLTLNESPYIPPMQQPMNISPFNVLANQAQSVLGGLRYPQQKGFPKPPNYRF